MIGDNKAYALLERISHLCLRDTDLVIAKEGTPGATAEHEGLHECSFGLDGVHQIVGCPRMKHLCQGDCTQLRMLYSPSQIVILHLLKQDKAFLTRACERSYKLLRRSVHQGLGAAGCGSKASKFCPAKKARNRTGKFRRSASSKCCKQLSADHSPAAGGRVSRSMGSVSTSRCQRSGVVDKTACTCSTSVFNVNLLLNSSA